MTASLYIRTHTFVVAGGEPERWEWIISHVHVLVFFFTHFVEHISVHCIEPLGKYRGTQPLYTHIGDVQGNTTTIHTHRTPGDVQGNTTTIHTYLTFNSYLPLPQDYRKTLVKYPNTIVSISPKLELRHSDFLSKHKISSPPK